MLRRKLWRTAKVYKVQFISMILLIALGIGVFVGFNAEWVTIGKDTGAFFRDCGYETGACGGRRGRADDIRRAG